MRSIFIDELRPAEVGKARAFLDAQARRGGVEDLWWLPLPRELWAEGQEQAGDGPYRLAVEAGRDWLRFELLVRGESLRNLGGGWADGRQLAYLMDWVDKTLKEAS